MPMQTWTARFVVDHGRVTEEGGLLRTFPRRRMDEPDVDLHILADPSGTKGADLGAQAIDNVGKLFLDDKLSLTGGMLRAVRSTHQTLQDWNRRSMPSDQVTTGITAALLNGTAVYLLQTGPGLAFLRHDGALRRLDVEPEALAPLGEETLEPALRRIDLEPGDVLVVASEALLDVTNESSLDTLLARGIDEALPELYLLTRDLPSFALFAVTCFEQDGPEPQAEPDDRWSSFEDEPPQLATRETPDIFQEESLADADGPEPNEAQMLNPPPLDISRPVVRLRGSVASSRNDYARTTGSGGLRLNVSPRLLAMLGAAALVLFVGAFTVPNLIHQNRSEKVALLLDGAQTQLQASTQETDAATKRQMLEQARSLASEALHYEPDNQAASSLRQQAALALDDLSAVTDLGSLNPISDLTQLVTGDLQIDGLTLAAGNAYMLDSKGGRIIAVPLATPDQPAVVYQDGDTYGDTPAKKPLFMTWESDNGGRLLILDAERKLFALQPGSLPQPLPLRKTSSWASVAGLASYDGNLYVLDPTGNQVERYLPAADGYDSEPTNALSGDVDLSNAVSIAVNGDIYVLKRDGTINRYVHGENAGFDLGGIDRPLTGPTSIQVGGTNSEIYIADAGNKRIVVASSDGTFERQYVSSDFTDVGAIAVDGSQLYVMVGDELLSASLTQ